MNAASRGLVLVAVALLGCQDEPVSPSGTGGLVLQVANASSACGAVDAGQIYISGPMTDITRSITPGSTDTIKGLREGDYSVGVEGFIANEVDCFGQTSVHVTPGQNTRAILTLDSLGVSTLSPLSAVSLGRQVSLSFSSVSGITDYYVETSRSAAFPSTTDTIWNGTSGTLTVADSGHYFFRVRAKDPWGNGGRASAPESTFVDPVTTVGAGGYHTCAVTKSGVAYCWGYNGFGELGDRTRTTRLVPTNVVTAVRFKSIAGGSYYTCGLSVGNAVYCWGDNRFGQLGNANTGTTTDTLVPVQGGHLFTIVSTSVNPDSAFLPPSSHSCGLTTAGSVWCWGSNEYGQLGDGSTSPSTSPVQVAGTFDGVTAGGYHTCSVSGGAVYCWGNNGYGQLGDKTSNSDSTPVPVTGFTFSQVRAGGLHTCSLTTGGIGYCWGWNAYGQLGHGDAITTPTDGPRAVSGSQVFSAVAAGDYHTCGVTMVQDAYCWGDNSAGELGDGSTSLTPTPSRVQGGYKFVAVSASFLHTCAIDSTGAAYCWGRNREGQLGTGTTSSTANPVPVRVVNP